MSFRQIWNSLSPCCESWKIPDISKASTCLITKTKTNLMFSLFKTRTDLHEPSLPAVNTSLYNVFIFFQHCSQNFSSNSGFNFLSYHIQCCDISAGVFSQMDSSFCRITSLFMGSLRQHIFSFLVSLLKTDLNQGFLWRQWVLWLLRDVKEMPAGSCWWLAMIIVPESRGELILIWPMVQSNLTGN